MNSLLFLAGFTYLAVVGATLSLRHNNANNNKDNINPKEVQGSVVGNNPVFAQSFAQVNEKLAIGDRNPGFLMPNVPHRRNNEPFKMDDSKNIPAHQKALDLENLDVSQFTKTDYGPANANQKQNFDWIKYRVASPKVLSLP